MKISDLAWTRIERVPRVKFKIATRASAPEESIILKIKTDERLIGYGEACPSMRANGDSMETIGTFLKEVRGHLLGHDPLDLEAIHQTLDTLILGKTPAKAGIDMACYDILGKASGLPLYKLLGGARSQVISDMTIGIDQPQAMADLAKAYVQEGFTSLKVKVGLDEAQDLEAIRLIREAVGPGVKIRLDANQGYSKKQAVRIMKALEPLDIEEIEQPLVYWDFEGTKFVKDHISQEVMMDESVHLPHQALRAIKEEATDMINIKLMKSGGILPALKINALAEAGGLATMVGCMSETRVGITAGAHLAAAKSNIAYVDLDAHRMIEEIPSIRGGFVQEGETISLLDRPGLGLELDF